MTGGLGRVFAATALAGVLTFAGAPAADGSQITVQLFLNDVVNAMVTCGGITGPLGSPLVGTINFQNLNPKLTFPAATPSDQPLNWNISTPFPATGHLNIHVEPLTS
jgi:hypothetical protein